MTIAVTGFRCDRPFDAVFQAKFSEQLLPEHLHKVSLSFPVVWPSGTAAAWPEHGLRHQCARWRGRRAAKGADSPIIATG